MTDYKRVLASDFDFDNAPAFRKIATVAKENVVVAKGGEEVVTLQPDSSGKEYVETKSTTNSGDLIVTRTANDRYIIRAEKFPKLYEEDPHNPGQYRSKNFGNAVQVTQDVVIAAPWGEDQQIKARGVIFRSFNGDVYGNAQHSFEGDFAREAKDGSLMPLTSSLPVQMAWAMEKGEAQHIADIEKRMSQKARATLTAGQKPAAPKNDKVL